MADIPEVVWELAAYIHDELYYHKDKYPDETSQLWFLRESIDGIRCDAEKPYQAQNDALAARIGELEAAVQTAVDRAEDFEAENVALRQALGAADKALKPFAKFMSPFTVWSDPEVINKNEIVIRSWDDIFRRAYEARAIIETALKKEKKEEGL